MRFMTLVAAAALALGGCDEGAPVARAPLTVSTAEAVVAPVVVEPVATAVAPRQAAPGLAAPAAARPLRTGGSTQTGIAVSPTREKDGLRGVSSEFPWGNGGGGVWSGTGVTDPEPLKKISDEEMMKRATNLEDQWADRQHALVSIGRRHLPGAMEAFRQAMDQGQERGVREMALSGLMEHGGTEALPLMWDMLRKDTSAQLRGQAIWAIALYGADEARKAIDYGLADEALPVRNMATLAIWALKDRPEEALPLLEAAIQSDEQMIFQEGFYNLTRMPYPEAGDILERAARTAKDEKRLQKAAFSYRVWRRNFPDLKQ